MCSVNGCTRTGLADLFMVGGVYGFNCHTHTYLCILFFLFHSYAQRSTRGWTLNRSKSFLACPAFRLTSLSSHFPSSFLDFLELPAANSHTKSMSCYGIIFQLPSCHVLERNRWFPCPEDLVLTVLYPSSHASPAVLWLVLIGLEDIVAV